MQRQNLTAWSVASPRFVAACYHADEALAPQFGLKEAARPYFPLFDLASMTKPLFTNTLLRLRPDFGADLLTAPLHELPLGTASECFDAIRSFSRSQKVPLTLLNLLDHTSGAKNWFWFGRAKWIFQDLASERRARALAPGSTTGELAAHAKRELTRRALELVSEDKRNHETVYSDVNYYLLSRIIEGMAQFDGWQKALSALNLELGTRFSHSVLAPSDLTKVVPSYPYVVARNVESVDTEHLAQFGFPHDTNTNILSSLGPSENVVTGHSGLVGNAMDVVRAMPFLARTQTKCLRELEERCGYVPTRFCIGLETPQSAQSLAGLRTFPLGEGTRAFGHLGYAGTSFWFAQNKLRDELEGHVLLTNRTSVRKRIDGSVPVRLGVCYDITSNAENYFRMERGAAERIDADEFYALNLFHFNGSCRFWDSAVLRAPADISDLRRTVGREIWSL